MTKVAILPVPTEAGQPSFTAVSGDKQSRGITAGAALDALISQLPADDMGTLIVLQHLHPDHFFTAAQQQRLEMLMSRWRDARDRGECLPVAEQSELDQLVDAELQASGRRAAALADELMG